MSIFRKKNKTRNTTGTFDETYNKVYEKSFDFHDIKLQAGPIKENDTVTDYVSERWCKLPNGSDAWERPIMMSVKEGIFEEEDCRTWDDEKGMRAIGKHIDWMYRCWSSSTNKCWVAFKVSELNGLIRNTRSFDVLNNTARIIIDDWEQMHTPGNKFLGIIRQMREMFPDMQILVNNVSSLEELVSVVDAGANGAIITSSHSQVCNWSVANVLHLCDVWRKHNNKDITLVCDYQYTSYEEMVIALALGADYVTAGQLIKAAGNNTDAFMQLLNETMYMTGCESLDKLREVNKFLTK